MFRLTMLLTSTVFLVALRPIAAEQPAAKEWVSPDAWIVAEITRPDVLLERAFSDDVVAVATSLTAYKEAMAKQETQQAMFLVNYFKGRYDSDLPTLLRKLSGGGITLAVGPNESNLLIVECEDVPLLIDLHEFLLTHARDDAKAKGLPDPITSASYRDVTGWSFGRGEAHAIIGNRLLLSNKPEVLKAAIDRRADADLPSLADSESFQQATQAISTDAVAKVYANMSVLKAMPGLKKALSTNENPLATLLFAPLQESLRKANWVTIAAEVATDSLQLTMVTDGHIGDPSAADGFALPGQSGDGAMPSFVVPGQIAGISLYRDLYRYYGAKDELFPERSSGIIFFENMMGIFFTGRDLTEEVLAEIDPHIRVVVAKQQYPEEVGTPRLQLPGLAVVLKMRDREKFAPIMEEAWQKAIGLVNFTRGQRAEPGLIIDKPQYAGVIYTTAAFSTATNQDRSAADARYNFQPTLAMPEDYLILSSSDSLTRDLIDQIAKQGDVTAVADTHSLVELKGPQLADILHANFDTIVRNNMVEKGNTRDQAEQEQETLIAVLQHLRNLSINAGSQDGCSQVKLVLDFELSLDRLPHHSPESSQQGEK